ncbi:hypothetical protein EVAR_57047_1 [Eumeta japonica]|uniref:Uncharacterized protein n=1 Tax=Eumeta variegata TaxID=151549 RepID=A0A4C1YS06_EUMVA|nr:hypothetical protein EVAR_57047_1 [Eumeta japonica]
MSTSPECPQCKSSAEATGTLGTNKISDGGGGEWAGILTHWTNANNKSATPRLIYFDIKEDIYHTDDPSSPLMPCGNGTSLNSKTVARPKNRNVSSCSTYACACAHRTLVF